MKLKRKIDRYKLGGLLHYLTYIILGVLLALVGMKTIRLGEKMISVENAIALYDDSKWIEAEQALQNAKSNDWFYYKQKKIDEMLIELTWVTKYRQSLQEFMVKLDEDLSALDYEDFKENLNTYDEMGLETLEDWQLDYLMVNYPVDTVIHNCWQAFKQEMETFLEEPLEHDHEWAKKSIFEVPDAYFSGEKTSEINTLLMTCDMQLIEALETPDNSIEEIINAVNDIYDFNTIYSIDSEWLNEPIKEYLIGRLIELSQPIDEEIMEEVRKGNAQYSDSRNQLLIAASDESQGESESINEEQSANQQQVANEEINVSQKLKAHQEEMKNFFKAIKKYRQQTERPYYDGKVEEIVLSYIEQEEAMLQALVDYRYYDEAIDGCNMLNDFNSYTEIINKIMSMREYVAPWSFLGPSSNYPIYQVGDQVMGASRYVIAFNDVREELELGLLEGTPEAHTIHKISVKFSDINLSSAMLKYINTIEVKDNAITFKAVRGEKEYIWILAPSDDSLKLLFEKQGDQVELSDDLMRVTVLNPTDESIPNRYTYLYSVDGYTKEDLAPLIIDLKDEDLMRFMGHQVKFACYVPETDEGNPATCYAYEDGGYVQNKFAQIFTEDSQTITAGYYEVIGELEGTITYFDPTLGQEMVRPIIRVTQLDRQEDFE